MAENENQETFEEGTTIFKKPLCFLLIGIVLIIAGIMIITFTAALNGGGSATAGIVIFVGPFPIVIGAGPDANLLIFFSIFLAVLSFVIFLVMSKKLRFTC